MSGKEGRSYGLQDDAGLLDLPKLTYWAQHQIF